MEAHSYLNGYQITDGKIPIIITLRKVSELKPHEETVPEDLKKLVEALTDNPVLRHPIIADEDTGIVLDGTHRLAAVKQLGCNVIPVALVDYGNSLITVERWFRSFSGSKIRNFEKNLRRLDHVEITHKDCERGLASREWYATIESAKSCLAFSVKDRSPYHMIRDAHSIEMTARRAGVGVSYRDNDSLNPEKSDTLVMSTIKILKNEVVETVGDGKLFPPKSTRHLVPSRPLGGGVPINWLQSSDFSEVQSRYHEFIQSRKVKRLPEGSQVGSRRYLEEVFLFE